MTAHEIRRMPLTELAPAEYNPREISPEALEGLTESVRRFGLVQPIVWNKRTGKIVGGHQRVKALERAGATDADVVVVDLGPRDEKALNLSLNNPAIAGGFTEALGPILGELSAELPEFTTLRLPEMRPLVPAHTDDGAEDQAPGPAAAPVTKPGDTWLLGEHRVHCGDATQLAAVQAAAGGARAAMVFTDPPYGVDYQAERFDKIKGDALERDSLVAMLRAAFENAIAVTDKAGAFYIWHASATRADFAYAMQAVGLEERQYLIWIKPSIALGWADYGWAHEPCFYAARAGVQPKFHGDRTQSTVWRFAAATSGRDRAIVVSPEVVLSDGQGNQLVVTTRPAKKKARHLRLEAGAAALLDAGGGQGDVWEVRRDTATEHPTQKPVALARTAIGNSSLSGEAVLDLFLGSGSTLLAAEQLGRRCFGLELEPGYCDVIVDRWEQATGGKARRQ